MTKLLEQAIAQVRDLPEPEQDSIAETLFAHMAGGQNYQLTDAQVEEVTRRRKDFAEGATRNATDAEMTDLWRRCGL